MVRSNGTIATVQLRADTIQYACVQSPVLPVDPAASRAGRLANARRLAVLLDKHANVAGPADLVSCHELGIGGFFYWNRAEMQNVAIDLPGPESEILAEKAREYGCWLTFGCYARDPDWPGHVLMLGVLMNPKGEIVARHWKARGSHGRGAELLTTTIYDVLPRYVEMYGWDAVLPVTRTEVGNISITGVQYEPMLFTALALKGCEICIRQASRSDPRDDIAITARHNGFYTSLVTNSISPGHRYFADHVGAFGITQIVGPDGRVLAKVFGEFEEIIRAALPLGQFRTRHVIPDLPWELYAPAFEAYRSRFAAGEFLRAMPSTSAQAAGQFARMDRWHPNK